MSWIWMMWIYSYGKMGNQTVQLVVQHCCKMSSKATFLVLLTTFKPVLHQIRSLQVVWILTSDWIKLLGSHAIHGIYVNCWKTKLFGPVKRTTCTDFVAKRRTTPFFPSFLLSFFPQPATTWFVARQFDSWVVNAQRGWLFNSFWSNVAKGDARFCCSFCCILIPGRVL